MFVVKTRGIWAKGDSTGQNYDYFGCFSGCSGCHPKAQSVLRKVGFGQQGIAENLRRKILGFII